MKKNKSLWLIVLAAMAALFIVQAAQTIWYNRQTESFPDDSVVGQGKPVLVEVGAESCVYCRQMLPVLTDLAAQYPEHFTVALVSLDKQPEAQQKYTIEAIPMQIFYDRYGSELYRHTGTLTGRQILDCWRQLGVEIP